MVWKHSTRFLTLSAGFRKRQGFAKTYSLPERPLYATGIQTSEIAHGLARIVHRLGMKDEVDAINQCYDEAWDAMIEPTEGEGTHLSKTFASPRSGIRKRL